MNPAPGRRTARASLLLLSLLCVARPADTPLLEAGRQFTRQLKLTPEADAPLFQAAGLDRAAELLTAVMSQGQTLNATAEDWAAMHRATAGLVEIAAQKGEWFRASLYAYMQGNFYRNFDHDFGAALEASRQALDLQQKSGLTDQIDISWSAVAGNLLSLGRTDEALDNLRQARDVIKDRFANRFARNWRDIVQAEIARKHPQDAARELQDLLDAARSAPAYFRAEAWMAQSDVRIASGDYSGGLESIRAAREAMTGDAKAADIDLEALNSLMICILDSIDSLPYAESLALAKRIDTGFSGLPIQLAPWAQMAVRARRRLAGDIEGVLREDTARLEEGRRSGNVYLQIEALRSLATTYGSYHSVANQIAAMEQSVALERTLLPASGVNRVTAREWVRGLVQLGDAYVEARLIGKAGQVFQEAIAYIDAQTAAVTRADLAHLRSRAVLGQARAAELDDDADTARALLQPVSKGGAPDDRTEANIHLARLERSEHPDLAARYYEDAVAALHAGRDRQWETALRLEAARFLAQRGEAGAARTHLSAAESMALSSHFADGQWRARFIAGLIAEKEGNDPGAVTAFTQAIDRLEQIRSGLEREEQRQALADDQTITELYQRQVAALTRLGRREDAWRVVERGKARAFAESLEGRRFRETVPQASAPRLDELEKKILGLRLQLAPENASFVRGAGREPAVLRTELDQAQSQFELARSQAGLAASRGSRAVRIDPPPFRAVQSKLAPDTALVEYSLLPDGLTAFVVTRAEVRQVEWKTDTQALRSNVLRLRGLLADPASGEEWKPLLAQVSAAVWHPVARKLPAVSRLILVPAGYLNYLPFHALTMEDGRAALDRYTITCLPSASTLLLLEKSPLLPKDLFLGALGDVRVEGFPPLPGTVREVEGIATVFPNAAQATGEAFTHEAAVRALQHSGAVHFATHGLLDENTPLFSALLVSPAVGQPSRLSMYELMDMDIHARLVVLSACETGLGRLLGGDEVAGLTRTILSAGASAVVSSLWKVSDETTSLLMQEFYRQLKQGKRAPDAMRTAELSIRKQHPHPFYWAPFTVTGAM